MAPSLIYYSFEISYDINYSGPLPSCFRWSQLRDEPCKYKIGPTRPESEGTSKVLIISSGVNILYSQRTAKKSLYGKVITIGGMYDSVRVYVTYCETDARSVESPYCM